MADHQFTPQEIETEEWRGIFNYESTYQASSLGRIRKIVASNRLPANYILTPTISNGYFAVWLGASGKAPRVFRRVHVLIAATFCYRRKGASQVNHKDGNKTNNRAPNLEYVTPKENVAHALKLGLAATGDRSGARLHPERYRRGQDAHAAKLMDSDIVTIRGLLNRGVKGAAIARMFHVSEMTISFIKHNRGRYAIDAPAL